jgi:hypothetical protein
MRKFIKSISLSPFYFGKIRGIGSLLMISAVILLLLSLWMHPYFLFITLVPLLFFILSERTPLHSLKEAIPMMLPLVIIFLIWAFFFKKYFELPWVAFPINFLGMTLVAYFSHISWRIGKNTSGYFGFVFYWLAFEYLMHSYLPQYAQPTLGELLAIEPQFLGWYVETGTMGGTLWLLISNLLAFKFFQGDLSITHQKQKKLYGILFILIIAVPVIIAYLYYAESGVSYLIAESKDFGQVIIPTEWNGQASKYSENGDFIGLIGAWMALFLAASILVKEKTRLKTHGKKSKRNP